MLITAAAGRAWQFSHSLGRPTNEHNGKTGGYRFPIDLIAAPDDILFVLSRGLGYQEDFGRIGKTTLDEEHLGDFARREFTWPAGMAMAQDSRIFVTDEWEHHVAIFPSDVLYPYPEFNPDGERIGQWGEAGSEPGQLKAPSGIEIDADDNVYVVDTGNDRVQKFTKDGEYILGWGCSGKEPGQFDRPWGMTIDREGFVYVADWGNDRIQKFTGDGEFVLSFEGTKEDGGDLSHPANVAVDSDGDVYVTDWGNLRVQIYEPEGDVIAALYGDAIQLSKAGEYIIRRDSSTIVAFRQVKDYVPMGLFERPTGIEVDDQDRVIVCDTRGRLQVYAKDKNFVAPELKAELL